MHVFLVFALGGGGEGGEAGELAAGDEPKHDFGGDENGDECSDCDYCNCHFRVFLTNRVGKEDQTWFANHIFLTNHSAQARNRAEFCLAV